MSKSKNSNLLIGALLNWGSKLLYAVTAFIITPVIISTLGKSGFGMWALIQSFAGYYGLVNLGLGSALQRFISRDLSLEDDASLQTTITAAIGFFTLSTGVVVLGAALLAEPAASFFEISTDHGQTFVHVMMLCAFAVATDFYGALFSTMLTSKERFDVSNGLGMARQVVQTAGIFIALKISPTLYTLAFVVCSISVISQVATFFVVRKLYPHTSFFEFRPKLSRLKELLYFGTSTVLITVSNIIRLRLGNAVIAKTTGLEAVATFNVATTVVGQMNTTVATSLSVLNPRFTRLHTQDRMAELQKLFRTALFLSATLACWIGSLIFLFGKKFYLLWVGPNFLHSVPILHVLTLGYVFALAQNPSWNLMFSLNKHHFMARLTLIEAILVAGLGFWLASKHGAIGFAWATTGLMLFTKIFIHAPYAARIADLKLRAYLQPMLFPFAIAATFQGLAQLISFDAYVMEGGLIKFLLLVAAVSSVFLGLLFVATVRTDYFPDFVLRRLSSLPGFSKLVRKPAV